MRILGIAGSPRHGSNSEIALENVLCGAKKHGALTKVIHICGMKIFPCIHCDACAGTGECFITDDAKQVFHEIEQADGIVIASPIYFMGIPSQLKALIDRAQPLWCKKYLLRQQPLSGSIQRRGLFVSVCGRTDGQTACAAESTIKAFFTCLEIKYNGNVAFSGVERKAQIIENKEALSAASRAGEEFASSVRFAKS